MTSRERILSVLKNADGCRIIDHHVEKVTSDKQSPTRMRYDHYLKQLAAERLVVTLTGVQGSGKSSILNAIAFDNIVLPIDVPETTCVPVEICGAVEPSSEAMVYFVDGRTERIPATEENLNRYVHQTYNPGNTLGVDRIVLQSDRPIFRSGMVLVDLPGTGSLTEANKETTRAYLDEAVGVVFVIRTVPPITRSEAIYIGLQWARTPFAFFLQNRWNDETFHESNSARDHNQNILKDIASRNRIVIEGAEPIHVVNAYAALEGVLNDDTTGLEESGLTTFLKALDDRARVWTEQLTAGIAASVETDFITALKEVDDSTELLSADREQIEDRIKQEEKRFESYIQKVKLRQQGLSDDLKKLIKTEEAWRTNWSNSSGAQLRNNMRTKFRQGIIDGSRLEKAMHDEESLVLNDALEHMGESIVASQVGLCDIFEGIDEWKISRPDCFKVVSKEERTKYENLARPILSAGGGVGGLVGGTYAAAKIGAALGSPGGPVGAIIGGVVGIAIGGLLGSYLGGKTREKVHEWTAPEKEVFDAIDDFISQASKDLTKQIGEYRTKTEANVTKWKETQIGKFEAERRKRQDIRDAEKHEKANMQKILEKDRNRICELLSLIRVGSE